MSTPSTGNVSAVALIRAAIAKDTEAWTFIMAQHSEPEHRDFMASLALVSARAVLSSNGWNIAKTLKVLDTWAEEYAQEAAVT